MPASSTLSEDRRKQLDAQDKAIEKALSAIDHRIIVFSGKGGVGKTTVSVSLAFSLMQLGYRTAILDADVTGPNVPKMVGLSGRMHAIEERIVPDERNGVAIVSLANAIPEDQPVMWRGPMRSKILYQFLGGVEWGKRDFMVADLPPGTGDEVMTLADKMQPDLAVIVTTPQEVSLIDSRRAINMAKHIGIRNIGVIENMSGFKCPNCDHKIEIFGSGGGKKQAEEMEVTFLGKLPVDVNARQMADDGQLANVGKQESELSKAIYSVTKEIEKIFKPTCRTTACKSGCK